MRALTWPCLLLSIAGCHQNANPAPAASAAPAATATASSTAAASEADAAFWRWFAAHADEVAKIKTGHEPIADELSGALHKVRDGLTFELGVGHQPYELIVSADGIKERFPTVQRLVAAAPKLSGWKVIAFRPRKPVALELRLGDGTKLSPAQLKYRAEPAGQKLDIAIYADKPGDVAKGFKQAAFLILDNTLGEYDVEMRIAGIDFLPGPAPADAQPLTALAARVDALK